MGVAPNIDITKQQRRLLLDTLRLYVPGVEVWAYGSRVKWKARLNSDLDLVMFAPPEQSSILPDLKDALAESELPFLVDLHIWNELPERFQQQISQDYVILQEGALVDGEHHSQKGLIGWRSVLLQDCMAAIIDYRGKTPNKVSNGIPLITAKIVKGGAIEPPTEFIAEADYDAWMRRGLPLAGDVVLTTEAPMGEVAQLESSHVALAQRIILLRGKSGVLDNTFLKFLLQSKEVFDQLASRSSGSTVTGIKQSELRRVRLLLPAFEEQKRIAAVLQGLSARIQLRQRQSGALEAIARAIFKSWFVDFDPVRAKAEGREPEGMDASTAALFPSKLDKINGSVTPSGWFGSGIGDICEVIDCLDSKKPERTKTSKPFLQLANIREDGLLDTRDTYFISNDDYAKWTSRMEATAGDCVITNMGRVGAVAQVPVGVLAALGRNMTGIRCQKDFAFPAFLIELLTSTMMRSEIEHKTDSGTILESLNVRSIPLLRFTRPTKGVAERFEELCRPLRLQMELHLSLSHTLAELRDTLLPRLISGKLRIPEAEKMVEAVL